MKYSAFRALKLNPVTDKIYIPFKWVEWNQSPQGFLDFVINFNFSIVGNILMISEHQSFSAFWVVNYIIQMF